MARELQPIRRVVTGNDARGRSQVVWDGFVGEARRTLKSGGRSHVDLWVWSETPAPLALERDDGEMPYDFPGPPNGGHLRVVQSRGRPADYDAANDPDSVPLHEPRVRPPGRAWDRGGNNGYSSGMHKTQSVDYGILLAGERVLVLDEAELVMKPGDTVIQVGSWHQWRSPNDGCAMAFDMISARFVDGPVGLAQGNDRLLRPDPSLRLLEGVKSARRIVTIDREPGKSCLVSDGPAPDVRFDAARPGYASSRLWVTDSTPASIVSETLQLPHKLEPPARGSVLRMVTFPPDDTWQGRVGADEVRAFFAAMGSPDASTYSRQAPHPYMQKTRTLDFCMVIEGEIVLVLDAQEVSLKAGEIVVQRGTNHAWSNRSRKLAVVAIASHDGA